MKTVALVLSLALAGCSSIQLPSLSGANPITKPMLYEAEQSAVVLFAGLNAYKQTCAKGAIPVSCKSTILKIQGYTRQIPPYLKQVRAFVRNNDQVNAATAYAALSDLIATAKSVAAQNGVAQ
jgi:hypothetical protein